MRIYIECTHVHLHGHNTGIQRVVRNFVTHGVALAQRAGVECRPVIVEHGEFVEIGDLRNSRRVVLRRTFRQQLDGAYQTATRGLARVLPFEWWRRFVLAHRSEFGLARLIYSPIALIERFVPGRRPGPAVPAAPPQLRPQPGDVLFLADSSWDLLDWETVKRWREHGAVIVGLMFDVIPLTHPRYFLPHLQSRFAAWFEQVVAAADGFICISDFTRQQLVEQCRLRGYAPRCEVVHLGHEVVEHPTPEPRHERLRALLAQPDPLFLSVGTIEPRKNHQALLDAFECLWAAGSASRLLMIGRQGWLSEGLAARIRQHPQHGQCLFWFDDVGDADLDHAYRGAHAVIVPSFIEGFGLPVVEALSKGKPVLASDIPVFREIASGVAAFFDPERPADLAALLRQVELASAVARPRFEWASWSDSGLRLLQTLRTFAPPSAAPPPLTVAGDVSGHAPT